MDELTSVDKNLHSKGVQTKIMKKKKKKRKGNGSLKIIEDAAKSVGLPQGARLASSIPYILPPTYTPIFQCVDKEQTVRDAAMGIGLLQNCLPSPRVTKPSISKALMHTNESVSRTERSVVLPKNKWQSCDYYQSDAPSSSLNAVNKQYVEISTRMNEPTSGTRTPESVVTTVNNQSYSKSGMKRKHHPQAIGDSHNIGFPHKRVRVHINEDAISSRPVKMPRHGSHKDMLVGPRMAIVAEDHPKAMLTEEGAKKLQGLIADHLLEVTTFPMPIINIGNFVAGALHIYCYDDASAKWLDVLNGEIVDNIKLKVIDSRDLPKPVKMAWRTRTISNFNGNRALKLLQRINPSLHTEQWKIIAAQVDETFTRYIMMIDKESAAVIKDANYRLHAGLAISIFKLMEDTESNARGTVDDTAQQNLRVDKMNDAPEILEQQVNTEDPISLDEDIAGLEDLYPEDSCRRHFGQY